MDCPRCGHPGSRDAVECGRCGVVPLPGPAPGPAARRAWTLGWGHIAAVVLVLGAVHWGYRQLRGDATSGRTTEPAGARQEDAAQGASPHRKQKGYDPASGLSTLSGLLEEIQAAARPHGVTITLDHLEHHFLEGARVLHPAVLSYEGAQSGLPIPERITLEADEKDAAAGARARCLVDGRWTYGDRMPGPGDGASECWERQTFRKNVTVGYPISNELAQIVTYHGLETVVYERRIWQPHNGRWAPYSEPDELRVMEHLMGTRYGSDPEWEDQEKMEKQIARAEANDNLQGEWRRMHIANAIMAGYETRLRREGARYRMNHMQAW